MKRILAWTGIGLLVGMYLLTLLFALLKSPGAHGLFVVSLYCTGVIPVLLFVSIRVSKWVKDFNSKKESQEETPPSKKPSSK